MPKPTIHITGNEVRVVTGSQSSTTTLASNEAALEYAADVERQWEERQAQEIAVYQAKVAAGVDVVHPHPQNADEWGGPVLPVQQPDTPSPPVAVPGVTVEGPLVDEAEIRRLAAFASPGTVINGRRAEDIIAEATQPAVDVTLTFTDETVTGGVLPADVPIGDSADGIEAFVPLSPLAGGDVDDQDPSGDTGIAGDIEPEPSEPVEPEPAPAAPGLEIGTEWRPDTSRLVVTITPSAPVTVHRRIGKSTGKSEFSADKPTKGYKAVPGDTVTLYLGELDGPVLHEETIPKAD